jgi:cytochrome c biogenesis protein CcmG, thiol:disulfide interchange protein DsbE
MQSVKIDRYLRAAIVVLSVALVYVISTSIHQRVVETGDSAPSFSVRAENGKTVSLPGFGGKVLVLNFWASWCPPCVQETPSLSKLAADYKDKGVVVLAISVDKEEKAYRDFLKRFQPAFLTARDFEVHEEYGTFIYPETYVIDAKGKVRKKIAEGADWSNPELTGFINSLL